VNDLNRTLLDGSIIETMPPFPSVDDVIVRERRRQGLRRGAGVIGIAAAVAGLVFAIQAGVGGSFTGGPPVQPGQSSSAGTGGPSPTTRTRTVYDTGTRLSGALQAQLSTVVPSAAVEILIPTVADETEQGYTGFMTSLSVRTSTSGVVELTTLWPVPGGPLPTAREFFGCGGLFAGQAPPANPADQSCEEHLDASGARIVLAYQPYGLARLFVVIVHYPDGAIVRISANNEPPTSTAAPILTLDELRRIATDPSMRP
jgi:hypothetical protein